MWFMHRQNKALNRRVSGFTLAELLIALAILGVVAVFAIPKVLNSQQDGKYNAITRETVAMVAGMYSSQQLSGSISPSTRFFDMTPFMNYVSVDTSTVIDQEYGLGNRSCSLAWFHCYKLHNGAMLAHDTSSFDGTDTTNAIYFMVDPDGKETDGTTNGPGKSMSFWLYYNGRITDIGNIPNGTCDEFNCYSPHPEWVPPWFSWD